MPVVEGGGASVPIPGSGFGTGLSTTPAGTPTSVQVAGPTRTPKKQPRSGDANRQASTPNRPQAPRPAQPQRINPGLAGVNASVAARIQALIAAAPGRITINSGFRTRAQQQKLYDDYRAGKGNLAAKPGGSNHEHGLACDLGYQNEATRRWVQANAARFGLHFPVKGEPWHAEPVESRGLALSAEAVKAGFKQIDANAIKSSGAGRQQGEQAKQAGVPAQTGGEGPVTAVAAGAPATAGGAGSMMSNGPDVFGPDGKIDPVKALQTYGYIWELANSVPELRKKLTDAIANDWSAERFAAEVQTTKWWKSTSDRQRQVLEMQKTNPGEYKRQRQLKIDQIVIESRNLGVPVDKKKVEALADKALSLGWSDQEISRFVAADIKVADKGNTGAVAVTVDSLKEQAEQYGVPLSKATLQTWTTQILRGMVPPESFESYLKEQAKSLFPSLAGAIDAGISVAQYTAPYRELTAEILELNPADIRMNDKHIQKALYAVGPDGKRTQMTLSEYQEYLRGTEGYTKTRQASESAASFVNTVTDLFGKTA